MNLGGELHMKKGFVVATLLVSLLLSACQSNATKQKQEGTTVSSYRPGQTGEQEAASGTIAYDVREIELKSNGNKIYGKAYVPQVSGRVPLVIFSHELGTTHTTGEGYAEYFASRGIAYYVFDFPGGSISGSRSEGKTTEMSVLTEARDLGHVLDAEKEWNFVDSNRIYLHGGSQGGLVSAVTATQKANDIAGLVLAYPAFIIPDQLHQDFSSLDDVPEHFRYIDWIDVGKIYAEDMWNYDVYKEISAYKGPVLILHGDRDYTVPMRYAKRAQKAYANATLKVISGGGHEFFGQAFNQALAEMNTFFEQEGLYR